MFWFNWQLIYFSERRVFVALTAAGESNHAPNGYGMQHQVLEEENERLTENLRGKVQALKSVRV